VANPARPFAVILGGAKVSDKIGVIENLVGKCDKILIGGAMSYTFLAAAGKPVGNSLTEPDQFDTANRLRELAGDKLCLPSDSIAAAKIESGVATETCGDSIGEGLMGLDIGPATVAAYGEILLSAKTIVWNGPVGVFETPPFDAGTMAIAKVVAEATDAGAVSIIGGGDSAAAVDKAGLADRMTHISTGGGASLEFLEGKAFAAIDIIDDA
jgi:phosphoglycerate kinase